MIFDGLKVRVFHFISRIAAERCASARRAISIQPEGTKLLEKHAIRAVSCKALLDGVRLRKLLELLD